MAALTPELESMRASLEATARSYGLDFFDTVFELVSPHEMLVLAAREGFPTRYEHWRFGMEYRKIKGMHDLGSKIYEMVINNDPAVAYLINDNDAVTQKMVMAHVYAHVDFFKNSMHFQRTNRKMLNEMAAHRDAIRGHVRQQGLETVDGFIDSCLSLDNLIDMQALHLPREGMPARIRQHGQKRDERPAGIPELDWWHPPEKPKEEDPEVFVPQRDIMLFLVEHAPLEDWERDILAMMREESYYYAPQRLTKIMNEGWATYWHTTLMRGEDPAALGRTGESLRPPALDFQEADLYAHLHSRVASTSKRTLNPYKLGYDLFRDIEERWNRGMFGREWEECSSAEELAAWDKHLDQGREFILHVRESYTDAGFLSAFLTRDFCRRKQLYLYDFNERSGQYEITETEWQAVKGGLVRSLTNAGEPIIRVTDDNHRNRTELYLSHEHPGPKGFDLRPGYAQDTLKALHRVWRRPVHLETIREGEGLLISYDGNSVTETEREVPLA